MTFTKDTAINSYISNTFFGTESKVHEYFDYHWVGGVTDSSASVKIMLQPKVVENVQDDWFGQIQLKDESEDNQYGIWTQKLEDQIALHQEFTDLNANTRYTFIYTLLDKESN